MAETAPATYEDLLKVPDHLVAEIVDGELFMSPRPASRHARASFWWIIDEPELHLPANILVPDLAGWRRERMPSYPDAPVEIDLTHLWSD